MVRRRGRIALFLDRFAKMKRKRRGETTERRTPDDGRAEAIRRPRTVNTAGAQALQTFLLSPATQPRIRRVRYPGAEGAQ
jgi:hypothetical protein